MLGEGAVNSLLASFLERKPKNFFFLRLLLQPNLLAGEGLCSEAVAGRDW